MRGPMRTVSFRLPAQLDDELTSLARRRKSRRSALVREALATLAKGERRSVTAMVDKVLGELEGPSDLSTNPKHMAEYGR